MAALVAVIVAAAAAESESARDEEIDGGENDVVTNSNAPNAIDGPHSNWEARVDRVRDAVLGWRARLLDPDDVVVRSPLAGDDKVFPSMPCSQLAWWAISVAVEHLDATIRGLDQQVSVGGPILPMANFTVLRAALVGASHAVVLLGPASRTDRTTAGLQMAHEEYKQSLSFRTKLLSHPGLAERDGQPRTGSDFLARHRERKEEVARLLAERGAPVRLHDTTIIERAAELVHVTGNMDAELLRLALQMEWSLGSGAAHGRLLMTLHRVGGHRIEDGTTALFGGTYEEVAQQVASVALVLSEAWCLWALRNIAPT